MDYIEKLNDLRYKKGLSFRQLGFMCDLSESAVKKILYRKNAPLVPSLEKLCAALGTSLSELFCSTDEIILKNSEIVTFVTACDSLPAEAKSHFFQFVDSLYK
jgi:transcriptional regulator with XRE-family HTH domain